MFITDQAIGYFTPSDFTGWALTAYLNGEF
jgi:hypothetical protein